MKAIILDIETIPKDLAELEAQMPEDIRGQYVKPTEPVEEWEEACPKYASDKNRDEKRQAWKDAAKAKWEKGCDATRLAHEQARYDFVDSAALDPMRSHLKMCGMYVMDGSECIKQVYVWEPDFEISKRLSVCDAQGGVYVRCLREEFQVIDKVAQVLDDENCPIITFNGNTFDLPYMARRGVVLKSPRMMRFLRSGRKGRYLDQSRFVDLLDEFKLGDNQYKTGGMNALLKNLGLPQKTGEGKRFHEWYKEDPAQGLAYNLNDVQCTLNLALAMGVL